MKTMALITLLQIAGLLHLGLICAGAMMPRAVNLRENIAGLPPFIRRLFWVYYSFIGLCLVSFGAITVLFASTLAGGSDFARAICLFFAAFWTVRLIVATFVFDVRPYLANGLWRVGYYATNIVFIYLPVVYGAAAIYGGK
jgi:hypothetical protein